MKFTHLWLAGLCVVQLALPLNNRLYAAVDPTDSIARKAPENWFNLDQAENHVSGVSTEKAYQLLKNRPSQTVVVAVIDGGVDVAHEDLQGKIWTNEKEIPGNGIDDDKNGYVDDVHGWNFIGGKDGKNVGEDSYELTRTFVRLNKQFKDVNPSKVSKKDRDSYALYLKTKAEFEQKMQLASQQLEMYQRIKEVYGQAQSIIKTVLGKENYTDQEVDSLKTTDEQTGRAKALLLYMREKGVDAKSIDDGIEHLKKEVEVRYNTDFDPRSIVGDHYDNLNERYYGNNDVTGPDADHGTHVAGIIAANRDNTLGIRGVAENVKIMAVRVVPDGDERDKDVANGIRYAVDNGAKIINMSFGKDFSPNKEAVDAAINYATSKGVLLVHAAGNDGENIDTARNFPTVKFSSTEKALKNWIEVGASSWKDSTHFAADFSNYGKKTVDVFAPGVDIYSTSPHQKYVTHSGTSMAAPVTSGVAALVMSYFPNLSVDQVKEVIVKSTVKYPNWKVDLPGEGEEQLVPFDELSKTGGVVNAYEAVKMAESLSNRQLSPAMNR